jgi:hypothetical protein
MWKDKDIYTAEKHTLETLASKNTHETGKKKANASVCFVHSQVLKVDRSLFRFIV